MSDKQEVFFHENAHGVAKSVGDEAELELGMDVHEFLDRVMVVTEGQHFID